ncbi:DUF4340 domain-containing protein [Corallococcus sp. M34]|uniref:DUF4340 domain-containing protein n=1 Tax=Citreicoccus inhibens TaxID=2849499 RepID=UPI001C24E896|nr:DUF4340 domain-containing protein [Citreicoccus inhibens]MBU8897643.1 DUF4340 domain-containing protein [Citreicoccus inhibens]
MRREFALILAGLGLTACKPGADTSRANHAPAAFASAPTPDSAAPAQSPPALSFTRLTVKAHGTTTELVKDAAGWRITAPVEAPADSATVEALLRQLATAKPKATVKQHPSEAELRQYGLAPPVFEVEAQGFESNEPAHARTVKLSGGNENPFDASVYLRRDGDPTVYSADGTARVALDQSTYALRSKDVLGPLAEPRLGTVTVTTRTRTYVLERAADGSAWKLVKPVTARVETTRVAKLLSSFVGQTALAFPDDTAEGRRALGLEKPEVDARFVPLTGEPVRIRLGRSVAAGDSRTVALREEGSRAVLAEVPDQARALLDLDPTELKDRHVLVFRREDVRRVSITPGDGAPAFALVRAAEAREGWTLEGPSPQPVQHFRVLSILGRLGALRATASQALQGKAWQTYGVRDTARGVALQDAAGHELARLSIGDAVPHQAESRYARGSGPDVLEIPALAVDELPWRPDDVRAPATPEDAAPSEPPEP